MRSIVLALSLCAAGSTASANLAVVFDEGAPKDTFTLTHQGTCLLSDASVVIDLSGSVAGLIFDVTGEGAGVQVFQPLELVSGGDFLRAIPEVRDGDTVVIFEISNWAPKGQIVFTIDVDDTAGLSESMVTGSEITGAAVSVDAAGATTSAEFGDNAQATVVFNGCNA